MLHNYLREVKQSFFWRRISQSEIRNLAVAERSGAGGQDFFAAKIIFRNWFQAHKVNLLYFPYQTNERCFLS